MALFLDACKIIVGYVGGDILDFETIDLEWPSKVFFRMQLSCLQSIIYHKSDVMNVYWLDTYDIPSIDRSEPYCPNTDILYQMYFSIDNIVNNPTIDDQEELIYNLCVNTPLSTPEYIETYPLAVNYSALSESKYVDVDYMLTKQFDKIDWSEFTSNMKVPLEVLNKHPDKIDHEKYYARTDVSFDSIFHDQSKKIPLNIAMNPKAPVDLIIRKHAHRLSPSGFIELTNHPDAPLEYILSNMKDKILYRKPLMITILSGDKLYLLSSLLSHPKLPFETVFKDYFTNIDAYSLCCNPNLPIDWILEKYPNMIKWDVLCSNSNFPVKLINESQYQEHRHNFFSPDFYKNEQLPFDKIDNINRYHNGFIRYANRGYYFHLIGVRVLKILMSI